jgi:hypothetical protein
MLRLDGDGAISTLELTGSGPVETYYGALSGGRLVKRHSVIRRPGSNKSSNASVTFEHPGATITIDRTIVTSDDVLPLIEALQGFCGD